MDDLFLTALVLFGIVLSSFLVVLILSSKSFRNDVHTYFALSIISLNVFLTYSLFEEAVPSNGILEIISWDFLFSFAFLMYVLKAIKHSLSENKKIWLLGIPIILLSLTQTLAFIFDFDLYEWLSNGDDEIKFLLIEIRVFSFLPYSIALIGFAYSKIRRSEHIYKQERRWLEFNSITLLVFLVSLTLGDVITALLGFNIWDYLIIILAAFLVLVAYLGVHQLNISEQRRQIKTLQTDTYPLSNKTKDHGASGSSKTQEKIEKLISLLVEDRLFLNPQLSRSIIAEKLGLSEGYLSEILKSGLSTNFNDFVNEYRVKYVIEMFNDSTFDLFSIEAIGFEAGFKTKSVFYSAFKKVTHKTPGAYRKTLNMS